jgi:hypothetical protein
LIIEFEDSVSDRIIYYSIEAPFEINGKLFRVINYYLTDFLPYTIVLKISLTEGKVSDVGYYLIRRKTSEFNYYSIGDKVLKIAYYLIQNKVSEIDYYSIERKTLKIGYYSIKGKIPNSVHNDAARILI